jgi:hypothetical protein
MNRILSIVAMLLAFAASSFAAMDDRPYNISVVGLGTNDATFVLRGELRGVAIDVPTGATGTVTVATGNETVFTKSAIAADAIYHPVIAQHTTAGAAATFIGGTNNAANAWYAPPTMAGPVTVTIVGESTGTNSYVVKLIYDK